MWRVHRTCVVATSLAIVYLAVGTSAQGKMYTATQLACLPYVAFEGASVLTKDDVLGCLAANQGATGPTYAAAPIPASCQTYLTTLQQGSGVLSSTFDSYWVCLKTAGYRVVVPTSLSLVQTTVSSGGTSSGSGSGSGGSVSVSITTSSGSSISSTGTNDNTAAGAYCTQIADPTLTMLCNNKQLKTNAPLVTQAMTLSRLYLQQ